MMRIGPTTGFHGRSILPALPGTVVPFGITSGKHYNSLWVAPELAPKAKKGGLGQIMQDAPHALNEHTNIHTAVMVPWLSGLQGADQHFEPTGLAKFLTNADGSLVKDVKGNPAKFELLQRQEGKTWQYAIKSPFFNHHHLYFSAEEAQPEDIGPDAMFKSIGYFNRAAAAFVNDLESTTPLQNGVKLHQFNGRINTLFAHDWLTGMIFNELPPGTSMAKVFMLHNAFNQARSADYAARTIGMRPVPGDQSGVYSPLRIGISQADVIIGNRHFVDTVANSDFVKGEDFVPALQAQIKAGRVADIHHGLSATYNPYQNDALSRDGFVTLAPNPTEADMEIFKQTNKAALQKKFAYDAATRNGLKPDSKAIIYSWVARFDAYQKGFELVARTIVPFMKTHPDAQLVIVGEGDDPASKRLVSDLLQSLQKTSKLQGRYYIQQKFADNATCNQIQSGSVLYKNPSGHEPFGLSHLEAANMGNVVIANRRDGLQTTISDPQHNLHGVPETVWNYGQTGIFMKPFPTFQYRNGLGKRLNTPRSAEADKPVLTRHEVSATRKAYASMRGALQRGYDLAKNPAELNKVRLNALHYVAEHHNWKRIAENYVQIVQDTVSRVEAASTGSSSTPAVANAMRLNA